MLPVEVTVATKTPKRILLTKPQIHKEIVNLLASKYPDKVSLAIDILKACIIYRVGRTNKSISDYKNEQLKHFKDVLNKHNNVMYSLTAENLHVFVTNEGLFSKPIPTTLSNLLCCLNPDGNPIPCMVVKENIKIAIAECISENVLASNNISTFLDDNGIVRAQVIDYFIKTNSSNYQINNNKIQAIEINCLNKKLQPRSNTNKGMQFIPENSGKIQAYYEQFKYTSGISLQKFLLDHPPVIFYDKNLRLYETKFRGNGDSKDKVYDNQINIKKELRELHCNEHNASISGFQRTQVREFSVIVQPALTQSREVFQVVSIPEIDFTYISQFKIEILQHEFSSYFDTEYTNSLQEVKEILTKKFTLIFQSIILMRCKNFVMNGFNMGDCGRNDYTRALVLEIFISVYNSIKQTYPSLNIFFVETPDFFKKKYCFAKVEEDASLSGKEKEEEEEKTFRQIIINAQIQIIENQSADQYLNENATTDGKWFILNPSNPKQNGGYFLSNNQGLEEAIFQKMLVVPYDVIHQVLPNCIHCVNLDNDYNPINKYLSSQKIYALSLPELTNVMHKLNIIYNRMLCTPYNSFVNPQKMLVLFSNLAAALQSLDCETSQENDSNIKIFTIFYQLFRKIKYHLDTTLSIVEKTEEQNIIPTKNSIYLYLQFIISNISQVDTSIDGIKKIYDNIISKYKIMCCSTGSNYFEYLDETICMLNQLKVLIPHNQSITEYYEYDINLLLEDFITLIKFHQSENNTITQLTNYSGTLSESDSGIQFGESGSNYASLHSSDSNNSLTLTGKDSIDADQNNKNATNEMTSENCQSISAHTPCQIFDTHIMDSKTVNSENYKNKLHKLNQDVSNHSDFIIKLFANPNSDKESFKNWLLDNFAPTLYINSIANLKIAEDEFCEILELVDLSEAYKRQTVSKPSKIDHIEEASLETITATSDNSVVPTKDTQVLHIELPDHGINIFCQYFGIFSAINSSNCLQALQNIKGNIKKFLVENADNKNHISHLTNIGLVTWLYIEFKPRNLKSKLSEIDYEQAIKLIKSIYKIEEVAEIAKNIL